ncbi:DUF6332 family protein [Streptomyces lushanensis]|uniref:DUF6332 family protein n=1 Tax=Streptomyces lushanensis TaxID=1434255 RepID=UPI00082E6A6D|nr:DUF6332 family protein [Streptomyces lushanensis]
MGTRSTAERDAVTVEIGFAVVTGALAAGLVFAVVAGPAWYFGLPEIFRRAGAVAAAAAFLARVVQVLWRFPRRTGTVAGPYTPADPPAQPSQPGRTSPDS